MRYYCESNPQSINHVTPSVLMLDYKLQSETDRNCKQQKQSLTSGVEMVEIPYTLLKNTMQ